MEGDQQCQLQITLIADFNPLPPYGGRLSGDYEAEGETAYFNPLPPYGGRHADRRAERCTHTISIHSLRMEGDQMPNGCFLTTRISIHSLRMEGDCFAVAAFIFIPVFQSTPSVWRET